MRELTIRKATIEDIDFIIEAIISAEKSGTDTLSYARLFDMSEMQVEALLRAILNEDIEGQELCISGFYLACKQEEVIGACCGWIEGAEGLPSSILKSSVLLHFLTPEQREAGTSKGAIIKELHIERTLDTLQIESCYVKKEYRGQGVIEALINQQIAVHGASGVCKYAQLLVTKTNDSALRAYTKLGFELKEEKKSIHPDILTYLPSDTLLLLQTRI